MKKIVLILINCLMGCSLLAQQNLTENNTKIIKLKNRPADHFMIQLSSDHLSSMPDSISSHQKGFSRGFNAYFMLDKPFKTAPKFSIGLGLGVSSSNLVFKKMNVGITSPTTLLPFTPTDSTNHFKKYKLATTYLEIPLEFRFTAKPDALNKSFKAALGIKAGTLVNAHTKGKTLQDKNNNLLNSFIEKENSKNFFNGTRFMATARMGYGIFSVFGAYQLNNFLKDAAGPAMKMYQVGLTVSGL